MVEVTSKESPFTPGKPVPVEYFVARFKEIERLQRAINQASSGKNENILITGERGMGKSSLAGLIRYLAEKEYNFIGVHCFLGGVSDLQGMIRVVLQRILQEVSDKTILDKLKELFGKYIKQFTLFGIGVEFTTDHSELQSLVDNFLPAMRKINEIIRKENKKGIMLILDDLNGITALPDFAHFLKSFVDELATSQDVIPLLVVLVGIPERMEELSKHQPSVSRIFDSVTLSPMDEKESSEFFNKMFNRQNIYITPEALSLMIRVSGGFPMLMHEVGDAIFWIDRDSYIDVEDAKSGIFLAAEIVGRKYLDPQVYRVLRSESYRSTLRKIGRLLPLGNSFQRKEILEKIPERERKTFDNFLQRIKKIGIINETDHRGEYRFVNLIYHLYVVREAMGFSEILFDAEKENKK